MLEVIEQIINQGGSKLVIVKQFPFYSREDSQRIFNELKRLLDESKELGSQKRPKEKSEENKPSKQVSNKKFRYILFTYLFTYIQFYVYL